MDELFPLPPGGSPDGPDPTETMDPILQRRLETRPWEVRAAQWRAWALAESAFGEGVEVLLTGRVGYQSFRGLLSVSVPFRGMADHRRREGIFMSWVSHDPVVARVPLIFVFEPVPASEG